MNGRAGVTVDGGREKGSTRWIAISTSLAGYGDYVLGYWVCFFLQNYVVVIKKKKRAGGR